MSDITTAEVLRIVDRFTNSMAERGRVIKLTKEMRKQHQKLVCKNRLLKRKISEIKDKGYEK
jgi:hypothetical protein